MFFTDRSNLSKVSMRSIRQPIDSLSTFSLVTEQWPKSTNEITTKTEHQRRSVETRSDYEANNQFVFSFTSENQSLLDWDQSSNAFNDEIEGWKDLSAANKHWNEKDNPTDPFSTKQIQSKCWRAFRKKPSCLFREDDIEAFIPSFVQTTINERSFGEHSSIQFSPLSGRE